MSQPGCPGENGYQESSSSQFKITWGDPDRFNSLGELVYAIYITIHSYNHSRIHTKLKMPPVLYSRQYQNGAGIMGLRKWVPSIMIILGIETSCDETAAAVVRGTGHKIEVLSNVVSSQIELHKKYGGVVPEVAAREHVLNILPVVDEALKKAGIIPFTSLIKGEKQTPLSPPLARGAGKVDAIAVTTGPGLVTSLLVGVETAKTLAYAWRAPVVAINHIEGHIYANFIDNPSVSSPRPDFVVSAQSNELGAKAGQVKPKFPAIILTVSGGHTMLVLMTGQGKYRVLGETRDDAAGEAFDKAAQLLGLGYPGGPAVAREAKKFTGSDAGTGRRELPRPMINSSDFDFSFSGLKTALFYQLERNQEWRERIPEYAAEFQRAAVEVLVAKTIKAARAFNSQTVMLSGGVAANLELRSQLKKAVAEQLAGAKLTIPQFAYCTDNAVMIAVAGFYSAKRKDFTPWQKLMTKPNQGLV